MVSVGLTRIVDEYFNVLHMTRNLRHEVENAISLRQVKLLRDEMTLHCALSPDVLPMEPRTLLCSHISFQWFLRRQQHRLLNELSQ